MTKKKPTVVVCDVDINCTVKIPIDQWEGIMGEAEEEPMAAQDHLQWNLDLSYIFGDARITSVDKVSEMERE